MAMAMQFNTQASRLVSTYVPGFISDYTSNWMLLLLVWSLVKPGTQPWNICRGHHIAMLAGFLAVLKKTNACVAILQIVQSDYLEWVLL